MTDVDASFARHVVLWPLVAAFCAPGELAHDQQHVLRVYRWALRLAPEVGVDPDLAGAAALVHDLDAIPKDSPDRAQGGERSARLATTPLAAAGYRGEEIAAVIEAVRTSSWSRGLAPTTALAAVLQDADRLDAIGAIGIARVFACAQRMSSPARPGRLYDPADPLADAARTLDDRRQAVDHFPAKLLTLAAGMHLPSARAEGARRHAAMLAYLAELRAELG
jgi:uncharacterized protein